MRMAVDRLTRGRLANFSLTVTVPSKSRWIPELRPVLFQSNGHLQFTLISLFNGSLDRLMHERGLLGRSLPFELLKQQSHVNEIANSAPADGFGDHVRRELSTYPSST